MAAKQIPVSIGLILCDQVIVAEKSRDITPVNCFSERVLPSFPTDTFKFTILALLVDGLGDIVLEAVIEDLDTGEEIYRKAITGRFRDPLQEMTFQARVRNCTFPAAGTYEATLFADGEGVASRRFVLRSKGEVP